MQSNNNNNSLSSPTLHLSGCIANGYTVYVQRQSVSPPLSVAGHVLLSLSERRLIAAHVTPAETKMATATATGNGNQIAARVMRN